jgi:hypothetical protein
MLTELNQFRRSVSWAAAAEKKSSLDGTTPVGLRVHSFLAPSSQPAAQPGFGSKFGHSMRASR